MKADAVYKVMLFVVLSVTLCIMRLIFIILILVVCATLAPSAMGAPKKKLKAGDLQIRSRSKVAQKMTRPLTAEEVKQLEPKGDGPNLGTNPQPSSAGNVNLPPIESQIVGGKNAKKGEFSHQAALILDITGFCGGSLISVDWILTAAHCVVGVSEFIIYLGAVNVFAKKEKDRQTFTADKSKATMHEKYNDTSLENDIAVIKLSTSAVLGKYVGVVKLPKLSQSTTTFENVKVYVSGWGLTSDKAKNISPKLKFTILTVISNAKCQKAYADEVVASSMICTAAGSGNNQNSNICSGDSGGPMIIIGTDRKALLIAAVSFGSESCSDSSPSGFTRITSFLSWISNQTAIAIEA